MASSVRMSAVNAAAIAKKMGLHLINDSDSEYQHSMQ
jgi:hypothetical protein